MFPAALIRALGGTILRDIVPDERRERMLKVTTWLAVALCTFILGFLAATLWFPGARNLQENPCPPQRANDTLALEPSVDLSASANLPILAYCELVNNPDRYSGKVVRIRATL